MDYKELIKTALKYRESAYSPYSNFKVGAAVIMDDGKIYGGCNIENASYGATNCAERTAIFSAVAQGNKKLKAIALVGDLSTYTTPCGICRQVISEFSDENTEIILIKNENDYKVKKLEDLFPGAFTKGDLLK
ncbi:cytidine deaminase [Clostridium massiliodielmoense]|uniref:cytidine deaminase n=1 Tax=Clostridium massiliodielmoense TaxID=1776385 RepID=UPI0001664728|nr:cytidine deaminase [Clostridium massiliodielmoense]EDS76541.1 cytidine deaminase [Clostridium botulinum C str. Eklund]KEH97030.1 cytidine deaminase [Clostridium botulinum C/D str. BKT12695]NEZ49432.1 cytidine deaminase [Clostridium botulinum]